MKKRYDTKLVRSYRSYSLEDLCRIYNDDKLHPQTIRTWIREEKLEAISNGNKLLIYGAVWKNFHARRNKQAKRTLTFHEMKCLHCKVIGEIKDKTIHNITESRSGGLDAEVECSKCNRHNKRMYKRSEHELLHREFTIIHDEVGLLYDSCSSPCTTHIEAPKRGVASESLSTPSSSSSTLPCKTHIDMTQTNFMDLL